MYNAHHTTATPPLPGRIARCAWGLFCLLLLQLSQPAQAVQTVCNDNGGAGWPITDGSSTTISIDYTFADAGLVKDIDVDVDISHTFTGDLTARITSPGGSTATLFERPGTTAAFDQDVGPFGCSGDDIDVLFDDESINGPIENATCGNSPAYSGSHQPHNAAPNNLTVFDNEDPTGTWDFFFMDPITQDEGTMNEACITISSAAVTFNQWISTNPTCSDTVDVISVAPGTDLYTCYTLSNPGDEEFTLSAGDWNNNLSHDLSALEGTYASGSSQTINFGPEATGSSPYFLGSTTGTASVTVRGNTVDFPASESIVTAESITVTVTNATPGAANKALYLYNNLDLSRIAPTVLQADIQLDEAVSSSWTLTPVLQSDLNIDASGGIIPVNLYLSETGPGTTRNITITIAGSSSGTIANTTQGLNLSGTSTLYTVNVPITGVTSLNSGEAITLTVTNDSTGPGNRRVFVTPSDGTSNHSLVSLPSSTIINIDSIGVFAVDYATDPSASPIPNALAGTTIYIRATVSDPFGSFDITSADITLTDPAPTVQVSSATTTEVFDSGTDTKIFEYTYNIPAFPVLGDWRFDVVANEGSEGITHSNFIDFLIYAPPSLSVIKSASPTSANPGETIVYSISVSNTGTGTAHNITLDDTLSPYTDIDTGSFSCSAGCPGSGVTLGTPNFTTDGSGDVISWDLIMNGALDGGAAFTIQYQATIE